MRRIGAITAEQAAPKRERHKEWRWCRLKNEFFDDALWRVVAERTNLPLYQVQAFVGRLECLANGADPRGFVGDFNPASFGAALGMPAEQAARIYAALEHPDVRWVDQEHVATFYERNPDKEDATAGDRDRRRKARLWIRKELRKRLALQHITAEQYEGADAILDSLTDPPLFALRGQLAAGIALEAALSTGHAGHGVAYRDSVVATLRADQIRSEPENVDNCGSGVEEESADQRACGRADDPQEAARRWIAIEGRRIAIARMPETHPGIVDTYLTRWRDQVLDGDAGALMTVLIECNSLELIGANFQVEISRRCERYRRQADARANAQQQLPLAAVRPVRNTS